MKSPLSKRPALPSIFRPPRVGVRRDRRRPASGGGMYVVCGVSVSPGVPSRSVLASGVRSRIRVLRSARSRGVTEGGTTGEGARSPGRMPALSAATVGRSTLTWRDGGGTLAVGATEADEGAASDSDAADSAKLPFVSSVSAGAATLGTAGSPESTACSARFAGGSFLNNFAVAAGLAASGAAVGGATSSCRRSATTSAAGSATKATSAASAGASSTARSARLTTRTPRFTAVSFLGKYLLRIFSANSLETELEGTLTSTPSRRTSSMSRLVSSFSSLARSYIRILEETVMHSFSDAHKSLRLVSSSGLKNSCS